MNEFDQIRFGDNSEIYRFEKFSSKRPSSGDSGMDSLNHNQTLSLSEEHHHEHSSSKYLASPSSSSLLSSSSSHSSSASSTSGNSSVHSSPSKVLKLAMQKMKKKFSKFSKSRHSSTEDSLVDGSVDITFIRYDHHPYDNYHQTRCPLPLEVNDIYEDIHTKNDHHTMRKFVPVENEYDLVAPDEENEQDDDDVEDEDDDGDIILDSLDCFMIENLSNPAATASASVLPEVYNHECQTDLDWNDQTQIESSISPPSQSPSNITKSTLGVEQSKTEARQQNNARTTSSNIDASAAAATFLSSSSSSGAAAPSPSSSLPSPLSSQKCSNSQITIHLTSDIEGKQF